jgi:branched-chain amino acid transport system substrate-binding protein
VRAIAATNPDLVVVCSYPPDSVGIVKAVNEIGFKPKMIGGAMVGVQATALKTQLGPMLNGWVNYDLWLPVAKMQFPGADEFIKKYQARAAPEGKAPPLRLHAGAAAGLDRRPQPEDGRPLGRRQF